MANTACSGDSFQVLVFISIDNELVIIHRVGGNYKSCFYNGTKRHWMLCRIRGFNNLRNVRNGLSVVEHQWVSLLHDITVIAPYMPASPTTVPDRLCAGRLHLERPHHLD